MKNRYEEVFNEVLRNLIEESGYDKETLKRYNIVIDKTKNDYEEDRDYDTDNKEKRMNVLGKETFVELEGMVNRGIEEGVTNLGDRYMAETFINEEEQQTYTIIREQKIIEMTEEEIEKSILDCVSYKQLSP